MPVTADATGECITGWHKHRVPYGVESTRLQTLDIWIPKSNEELSSPSDAVAFPPLRPGPWIVYIHGGAWRDPLVESSSFERTATGLLHRLLKGEGDDGFQLAGIASLNYRLSPHPKHPSDPAPSRHSDVPLDPARMARHPDHIHDVLSALVYLQDLGVANDYILAGHSCGATLAFQVAMDPARWFMGKSITPKKPRTIVGLNGLYDLPAFLRQPPESHQSLAPLYNEFTRGAFGGDPATWEAVCPTVVTDWEKEWPEAERVVLVQSRTDSLVPYSQLEILRRRLQHSGAKIALDELQASGHHNELWQVGNQLLDILTQVCREWKPISRA